MKLMLPAILVLSALSSAVCAQEEFTFSPNPFIVPLPFGPDPPLGPPQGRHKNRSGPWQNDVVVYRSTTDGNSIQVRTFERAR